MNFSRRIIGLIVGKIVLRAQFIPIGPLSPLKKIWAFLFYHKNEITQQNNLLQNFLTSAQKSQNFPQLDINRKLLTTANGTKLDTILFSTPENRHCEKYVIYVWGRNDCYEYNLTRLASDALNLNRKIISFNFRNVCHSQGQVYSEQDLIDDCYFQAKRLIDEGAKAEDIVFYAHSLGAAVTTFATLRLHQEGHYVKIYNDRSFSNLIDTSMGLYFGKNRKLRQVIANIGAAVITSMFFIGLAIWGVALKYLAAMTGLFLLSFFIKPTKAFYHRYVGGLIEAVTRKLMIYGGWEMKATAAYMQIPPAFKKHVVLRTGKKSASLLGERSLQGSDDRVIRHEFSLHKSLTDRTQEKAQLKAQFIDAERESEISIDALKVRLIELSNAKMSGGDHMAPPQQLICRYKSLRANRWLTGQERFYAFVEPNEAHEDPKPRRYKSFN